MSLPRPLLLLAALGLVLHALPARAVDLPRQMTFQGRLVRADGSPETAPQGLRFALYAASTGGAPLWEESLPAVTFTNGYYSVVLGRTVALPAQVLNGQALYLGVSLVGQSELTPRLPVVSVPYALLADDSNRLQGRQASDFAPADHSHLSVPQAENSNRLQGRQASDFAPAGHSHDPATSTAPGFMSVSDKLRLDAQPTSYTGLTLTGTTLSVAYAGTGGNFGTLNTVARSNHTHPAPPTPTLACTHRTATGNIDNGFNSTAWCATNEFLTGGGCSNLGGSAPSVGITFGPTGTTPVNSPTPTGGHGYTCRAPVAGDGAVPTAHAICCRINP
jgi:hypothetical protein